MTNIRPINGFDFKAEATPVAPEPYDLIADYQLQIANGVKLESILEQYAELLAQGLDRRANDFENASLPDHASGLRRGAEQLRSEK